MIYRIVFADERNNNRQGIKLIIWKENIEQRDRYRSVSGATPAMCMWLEWRKIPKYQIQNIKKNL